MSGVMKREHSDDIELGSNSINELSNKELIGKLNDLKEAKIQPSLSIQHIIPHQGDKDAHTAFSNKTNLGSEDVRKAQQDLPKIVQDIQEAAPKGSQSKEASQKADGEASRPKNAQTDLYGKSEEAFEDRMRETLKQNNYSEAQIERMMKRTESVEASPGSSTSINRPTYIRVRHKHLDPVTLDKWALPWEWDESDHKYIIIKQWIPERQQEVLFEHTRRLKETGQLKYTIAKSKEEANEPLLIKKKVPRKKSPTSD